MERKKEVKKIVDQIIKNYKPEKIFIFGSFASGKDRKNSDVDLLVIKKTKNTFTKRLLEVSDTVSSPLGTDILVYTPREWEEALEEENYFIKEINKTGKLVYAR